jgi:hypothetical protein
MVTEYKNILSEELYKEVFDYVKLAMKEKTMQFTTSTLTWRENLKGNSVPVLIYDFSNDTNTLILKLKKEIENTIPYYISNLYLHILPNLSYINWHKDAGHIAAGLTLYLNEDWDKNWGGYLMYEKNDEIIAIKPDKNLGVLIENTDNHSVSTINFGSDLRISLQFFLTKTKKLV